MASYLFWCPLLTFSFCWCHIRTSHLSLPVVFGVGDALQHHLLIQTILIIYFPHPASLPITRLPRMAKSPENSHLYKMGETFVSPVGVDGKEEGFIFLQWDFSSALWRNRCILWGRSNTDKSTRCVIPPVLSHRFSHEDNIIAKSNNIQFPLPGLFGKVSFFSINNMSVL